MAWILIVVVIGVGSPNSASFAGEYASQKACESAADTLRAAMAKKFKPGYADSFVAVCTPKG